MNNVNTIRVRFSKTGRAKYISHLDLMRTMTRVMRRAQIPLWYTEGFSKHPYITFAAPLSLGYEGLDETMDFRLEEDMPMEEIVSRLNAAMPEGITVHAAAPAVHKAGAIASSKWEIRLSADSAGKVQRVLDSECVEVQKRTKKKTYKTVDIRPCITEHSVAVDGDVCVLRVTLPTGEQAVNPSLLLSAVFGEGSYEAAITRLGVYDANGDIFV